ncbi:Fic family protein [Leucobacter albus]|uniref:protein adenylyltransferase n=1 Tax=Leucobacter albus TaxID=272210 RepID=A0ABW3TUF0_9MICO
MGRRDSNSDLKQLERSHFIVRPAYHYDQFNYVHPFREGNGRTQRVFWNRVAREAGWELDWRSVRGATNDSACRAAAERRDLLPLQAMFDRIVAPASQLDQGDEAWQAAERARLSFVARHKGGQ